MRSQPFDFTNADGHRLSARLDLPDGPPKAFALFAHCFTCDKQTKAAVRIARALAEESIGVLRFDFTGLGESAGEFSATGFSANIADLVSAAAHMREHGCKPALLIGHSLGGAAVLAAADQIPEAVAVATIGAPFEPAHVLKLFGGDLERLERDGQAEVKIGGRPFTVRRDFVNDVRMQQQPERIARLGRALLVLHAPGDAVVGIDSAASIFQAAKHPKSFVSLDHADHLLTRGADADWAGRLIAAWAARYVAEAADALPQSPDGAVLVEETRAGAFQVQVVAGRTRFLADEPAAVGGLGTGPTPYELVAAGLGACTAMTLRLYADRKAWPLERVRVEVKHDKIAGATPPDRFERRLGLEGPLDAEQTARLFEMADRCPVHRTLEGGSHVVTVPLARQPADPAACEAAEQEHFREMQAVSDNGEPPSGG